MNGYQKHKRVVRTILKQAGILAVWIEINHRGWLDIGLQTDEPSEMIERDIVRALKQHRLLVEYPIIGHAGRQTWLPCLHITTIVSLDTD